MCSLMNGEKVNVAEYVPCLKELMDICMMCNDSGLSYNEVNLISVSLLCTDLYTSPLPLSSPPSSPLG